MEQINIYEGKQVISHILVQDGVEGLEACLENYEHVYAVMDENVAMKCSAAYEMSQMLNRRGIPGMLVEVSEESKCMDTVMDICSWLLENGADRDALVLAIGGGITTDMVGFAASIYKRGVRFAYVPTTLLAQVDASIGGKTGVNIAGYKNMLGTIRQPEFTYICPQVLESLPMEDFQAGAAEMLKTFIIEDNGNYEKSINDLAAFASEKSLTDEQAVGIFEKVNQIGFDAIEGIYTRESFEMAYNAMNYAGDVEKARKEGERDGRNERIEEKLKKVTKPADMPPTLSGQGAGVAEAKPQKQADPFFAAQAEEVRRGYGRKRF